MTTEEQTPRSDDDIWQGDNLDRKKDADYLINFLVKRTKEKSNQPDAGSFVLNLDAPWGHGKTYFLTRLQKQLTEQGHLVAYINAWEDDHAEDPLLAVIAEIDQIMHTYIKHDNSAKKIMKNLLKETATITGAGLQSAIMQTVSTQLQNQLTNVLQKVGLNTPTEEVEEFETDNEPTEIGEEDEETTSIENNEDPKNLIDSDKVTQKALKPLDKRITDSLNNFRSQKDAQKSFRTSLKEFLTVIESIENKKLPFFILIDELDRCRPTHAVEMLERIKHLFNIHNIVFVLATDTSQLRHVVRGVYGGDFDSTRYLLRFFNRIFMFMEADKGQFVKHLFDSHHIDDERLCSPMDIDNPEFFTKMMLFFDLSLRDIEQCFDMFHDFYTSWPFSASKIHLAFLLPLISTFQQQNIKLFQFLSVPTEPILLPVEQKKIDSMLENMGFTAHEKSNHFIGYISKVLDTPEPKSLSDLADLDSFQDENNTYYNVISQKDQLSIFKIITFYHQHAFKKLEWNQDLDDRLWNLENWYNKEVLIELRKLSSMKKHENNQNPLSLYPNLVKSAGRLTFKPTKKP